MMAQEMCDEINNNIISGEISGQNSFIDNRNFGKEELLLQGGSDKPMPLRRINRNNTYKRATKPAVNY